MLKDIRQVIADSDFIDITFAIFIYFLTLLSVSPFMELTFSFLNFISSTLF